MLSLTAFETSSKFNRTWLKELISRICRIRRLKLVKVSKNNYFQFSLKVKGKNIINNFYNND